MEIRRALWGASVRLAIVMSTIAALLAVGIDAIGDVSPAALAAVVAAVAFATSWSLSGRTVRSVPVRSRHRVAVVPVRHPVG